MKQKVRLKRPQSPLPPPERAEADLHASAAGDPSSARFAAKRYLGSLRRSYKLRS